MWPEKITDWVAINAASLSTLIALTSLWRFLTKGPKLNVEIERPHSPLNKNFKNGRYLEIRITNNGNEETTIYKIQISNENNQAIFDNNSHFKPNIILKPKQTTTLPFNFFIEGNFFKFTAISITIWHSGSRKVFKKTIADTGLVGGR